MKNNFFLALLFLFISQNNAFGIRFLDLACPICSLQVRGGEKAHHLVKEAEAAKKLRAKNNQDKIDASRRLKREKLELTLLNLMSLKKKEERNQEQLLIQKNDYAHLLSEVVGMTETLSHSTFTEESISLLSQHIQETVDFTQYELESKKSLNLLLGHLSEKFPEDTKTLAIYLKKESILESDEYLDKVILLFNLIVEKNVILANRLLIDSEILKAVTALGQKNVAMLNLAEQNLQNLIEEINSVKIELVNS